MQPITRPSRTPLLPLAVLALVAGTASPADTQDRVGTAPPPTKLVAAVQSKDGTRIAYERSGRGPVLILVGGALSDRSGAARLARLLEPTFTVINFDRRGRGASSDTQPHAVQREIEDIEALVDAVGGTASLFGSSSGAVLALEAAEKLGDKIAAAVLFEPPFLVDDSRAPIPEDLFARIKALVAEDRRGDAVAAFMREAIGVPEEMLAGMRQAPMWAGMEKLAHTLPYDGALLSGLHGGKPLPTKRWVTRTAGILVLDGELSDTFLRNAAQALAKVLPGAERRTLAGQDHSAAFTAPESLVPVIVDFLGTGADR